MNLRSIIEMYARPMGPRLFLLLGAVTSLLLIGCANVSILLLVRGAHRQQELAVRAAVGAAGGRIVRQLLTEAMAVATLGAALGVLIAWKGLALIVAWIPTKWIEIIGVVADARNDGLRNPVRPAVYLPYTLKMRMFTQILVRTRVAPLSILRDVRAELVRVDREQQVMRVRDLNGWITNHPEYAQQRLVARLFGIFSILALALSAVGLYSVVSYGVATRTNEFGIRMALGARARDVMGMVLSGTSWNVGAGLLAGVLLCLIFDNLASQWVTETSRDPLILGGVTILLLGVAAMACLVPARRAASIDPMDAVRHE